MPLLKNSLRLPDFSGGLNERFAPQLLADNESPACENVRSSVRSGALEKVGGYSAYNTTVITGAPKVTGLFDYKKTDLSQKFIVVANGKIYDASGGNFSTWVDITGSTIRSWVIGNDLNIARYGLAGCGTQTAGLSFGGYSSSVLATTEKYDGTNWSASGNLNTARRNLAGCGTQTAGLSFGGWSGSVLATTEKFNGTVWSAGNNLNTARMRLAGAGTQAAGLSFGGSDGAIRLATTEKYDGTNWSASGNLSTAKELLGGAGTQAAGLCFGGWSGSVLATTEEFNGTTWSAGGDLNIARYELAGAGTQTAGLSFGGRDAALKNTTEEYDGTIWTSGGNLNTAKTLLAGAGTQTAGLSFGGWSGSSALATTEKYGFPTLSLTNLIDFLIFKNWLILTDEQTSLRKWDGTADAISSLGTNPPTGKYLEVYKNYLITGYISAYPSRIQWSNVLDPETWTSTDWIDIDKDAGGFITGLEAFYDDLLIFKSNGIHKIAYTGDPDIPFVLIKITDKIGAISNWSIVQVEGIVYFAAYDGFYMFNGAQPIKISDKIQTSFNGFNKDRLDRIYGIHFKDLNQIWWAVATGTNTYNDKIFAYDYANKAWWKYGIDQAECFAEKLVGNDVRIYSGGSNGWVWRQDDGVIFGGSSIVPSWKSKIFDFVGPHKVKTLTESYASVKQATYGDLTLEVFKDFASTGNARTIAVAQSGVSDVVRKLDLTEIGRHFQFKLSQLGACQGYDATLNELVISFMIQGRE